MQGLVDQPAVPALSHALQIAVVDTTSGTTLYDGVPDGMGTLSLGSFAVGQSRSYRFTVSFPTAAADPALQGAGTTLTLEFEGVTP